MSDENTQLVPVTTQPGAVAVYGDVDQTGFGNERLKITKLTLVQNTTRETRGAKAGQILDELTGEAYDSLTVVPLKVITTRVLFPPDSDLDTPPICRSNDGIVPSQYIDTPAAARCKTCPYAQWENGQRPKCDEKRRLLVVVRDTGLPRFFTFGGKSITSWNMAYEAIKQNAHMRKMKGEFAALYQYCFSISGDLASNRKGKYYIARFDDIKRIANPQEFGPVFEQYVLKATHEDEEEGQAVEQQQADAKVTETVEAEVVEV